MVITALEKAEATRHTLDMTITWLSKKAAEATSLVVVNHCIGELDKAKRSLIENQQAISSFNPTDPASYETEYLKMLEVIFNMELDLMDKGSKLGLAGGSGGPTPNSASVSTELKLPKFELKEFNGLLHEWMSFRDSFKAAIDNNAKLSKVQKLSYLQSSLKGDAANLLLGLEMTDANYDIAWKLLIERYENERELFFAILRKFTSQTLTQGDSGAPLHALVDGTNACVRSLKALNVKVDEWDGIIVFLLRQKLDPDTKEKWEMSLQDTAIPSLEPFLKFLEQRARALDSRGSGKGAGWKTQAGHKATQLHHANGGSRIFCKLCKSSSHPPHQCSTFQAMSVQERRTKVKALSLCFNCLSSNHSVNSCSSKHSCRQCQKRHHTLLHHATLGSAKSSSANSEADEMELNPDESSQFNNTQGSQTPEVNFHTNEDMHQGMLATALIQIQDEFGSVRRVRALLDGGSTNSYISSALTLKLGLKRAGNSTVVTGLGSNQIAKTQGFVNIKIKPHFPSTFQLELMASVLPKVTGKIPCNRQPREEWTHLHGLELADPEFHVPATIDVLLGSNVFWDILKSEKRNGQVGSPLGIASSLGWLVAGLNSSPDSKKIQLHYADADLDKTLRKFWELESVPALTLRMQTKEEKEAESHYQATTTRRRDGTFVVKLPIKDSSPTLGSSREIAIRRFLMLEKRLVRNLNFQSEYSKFMKQYEELGHMSLLSPDEVRNPSSPTYYIPHHFVQKSESTSTKFRVVFDASAKTSNGISLNEKLLVGPTIQESLISILMRFRTHRIAFTADIEKMYRQISMDSADANLQRIVWRPAPNLPIQDYKLETVTYGTAAAPFHATRTLQELAFQESVSLPLAAEVALQDFYVDDLMSGASSTSQALDLQKQLLDLLKRGGMNLRKWSSNCPALLESLPLELRETQLPFKIELEEGIKTLGLHWNPVSDSFSFKVELPQPPSQLTKRKLLSEMAKIFDPLGLLAPVIIRAKILFQKLWLLQLGWDDLLPESICLEWKKYRDSLPSIQEIKIPRCILPEECSTIQLHGFSDASIKAYSAVVYLRTTSPNAKPMISLIASKTRVAPIKTISVPRLELCGAVLLAQLLPAVQNSLKLKIDDVRAWTDSTDVLGWIEAHPSKWKTFVANRATEIQENIPPSAWGHVDGVENPADCASRGLGPEELANHPLWWHGPRWLQDDVPVPYSSESKEPSPAMLNEERKEMKTFQATLECSSLLHRFSTLSRLTRVSAWCLRFIYNAKSAAERRKNSSSTPVVLSGLLSLLELKMSLNLYIKQVQEVEFPEIQILKHQKTLPAKSKLISMNPFLDKEGILRVGGRLKHSNLHPDQKNPILLPRRSKLTELIMHNEHILHLHAGPQLLHSVLNRKYWIIGARDALRLLVRRCVTCTRVRGETMKQLMGNLPEARVSPGRAFLKTGIDYAGPFILRPISPRSKITFKAYMAIFVCMSTRAVHLELVSSLSTESFISALNRFVSRRGKPSDLFSDCGTNFVGAAKEMKEFFELTKSQSHNAKVSAHLIENGTTWHFNPPGAPHFGGLWEAGVKSVKRHLRAVIGSTRLTFEELTTLLTQVEACLNSRPLTPISTDPNDLSVLTPGHFLVGDALTSMPEPDLTKEPVNRLSRWQLMKQMTQHFWKRWSQEYMSRLQQRPKWTQRRKDIRIKDIVTVKDDRLPPMQWKLARVTAVHPGDDGLVRACTLKTADGELDRVIGKLCLLPVDPSTRDETQAQDDCL